MPSADGVRQETTVGEALVLGHSLANAVQGPRFISNAFPNVVQSAAYKTAYGRILSQLGEWGPLQFLRVLITHLSLVLVHAHQSHLILKTRSGDVGGYVHVGIRSSKYPHG